MRIVPSIANLLDVPMFIIPGMPSCVIRSPLPLRVPYTTVISSMHLQRHARSVRRQLLLANTLKEYLRYIKK
jgi:hypothetical protein